jgi:hypothetical protein
MFKGRLITAFITGLMAMNAWASDLYELRSPMDVKMLYRGVLEHVAVLPAGTVVTVDFFDTLPRTRYQQQNGRILMSQRGWVSVENIQFSRHPRRGSDQEYALGLLGPRSRASLFVSEAIPELSRYIGSNNRRPVRPAPAPVYVPARPAYNMYEVCYEQPRTQWVTVKEEQARAGRRNTAIGAGAAIAGIILGGSNNRDVRNIGTAITIGGAALATVGLVQLSNSQGPVTVYDTTCEQYYIRDTRTRTVMINNQRCVTERYYSHSWDRQVEYFTTTCQGSRYYSFERHPDFWY